MIRDILEWRKENEGKRFKNLKIPTMLVARNPANNQTKGLTQFKRFKEHYLMTILSYPKELNGRLHH